MQIITGYTGKPHVTAEHDRDINIGLFGAESYVLPTGMMMEAEISSNNEIKIRDGVLMHQGCAGSIKKNTYDSVTITNGSQGMKRVDLIVVRYEKNEDTETEELKWVVLQGIPSEDAPETPEYTQGDIQAGDYVADMPMYEVTIDGLNITQIKKVFETTESLTELNGKFEDYIKSETFSGTTDSTSNIHVSSNPNRIYIAAQPNIGQRILFPFRYLENHTYIRVLTNAGAAVPNTAISGIAWYIEIE